MATISRKRTITALRARAFEALRPDTNESRPIHRLVAAINMTLCAVLLGEIAAQIEQLPSRDTRMLGALGVVLAAAIGVAIADFMSGLIHFYLDNYPTPETPVVGRMAAEFQRHHERMSDILLQEPANVTYATGQASAAGLIVLLLLDPHYLLGSVALFAVAGLYLSQLCHRWAHHAPGGSSAPRLVRWLQQHGVLLSYNRHVRAHHLSPWEKSYTIVTGQWNDLLDATFFWRRMERILYERLGWVANSWKLCNEVRSMSMATKPRHAVGTPSARHRA